MVLVTDGLWQKTLAVVRALGQDGVDVAVAAETRWAAAFYSRHCKRRVRTPSPTEDPAGWVDCLVREACRGDYDMILPMEDQTVALLGRHRSRFPDAVAIPIPGDRPLARALDKGETLTLCRELGLAIPLTRMIGDLSLLDEVSHQVPYPALIKPRRSSGARGIARARTPAELVDRYRAVHRVHPFPLIQEQIPVEGAPLAVGLLLDRRGEPVARLVQESFREYPPTGGSSTLRQTIADEDLCAQALALLRALEWYGVAQVEFKRDPRDGRAKVMEINPRFWNSVQLAIDAGVNFPALLHRMATGRPFRPALDYPVGIRSRWLLPGDLLCFLASPDRFRARPSFFAFFDRATRYEDFSLEDPGGMVGVWLSLLYGMCSERMRQQVLRRGVGA
jgi:predicted ATP-grasp superfamily ATP-dependent carboligase